MLRLTTLTAVGLVSLCALAAPVAAQIVEEALLIPATRTTSDIFGYFVDLDGTTIVGGAPFATLAGVPLPGRAFVYEFDGGEWQEIQTLRPSNIQANAFFGLSVAVGGTTIAAAAPSEDAPSDNEGAVYVFEKTGGAWSETVRLTAPDARVEGRFGTSLSLGGDLLVVGAIGQDSTKGLLAGAVYVFERTAGVWSPPAKLGPSDPEDFDNFGFSVARDGGTIVVGAITDGHSGVSGAGSAYVFRRNAGAWDEIAKLIASDPVIRAEFGTTVAIDGETVVVGAPSAITAGVGRAGAVYVYQDNNGAWDQVARLVPPDLASGDSFGQAVAIEGNTIVIGAYLADVQGVGGVGAAYVYRERAGSWIFDEKIVPSILENVLLGWSLAVQRDRAVISAPFHTLNQGAVYVYTGLLNLRPGDLNCDDLFNGADIDPFFLALGDPSAYQAAFPDCEIANADMNCDDLVNGADIDRFFACLAGINCDDCNANGFPDVDCDGIGPLAIVTQPQSATACVGRLVTLSVEMSSPALTYQWRKNGQNLPDATLRRLTIASVQPSDAGSYDVIAADACVVLTSDSATLTVNDVAAISQQPQGADLCVGDPLNLSVEATGVGLAYQWFKNNTLITGANQSAYSVAAVTRADNGVYRVQISNSCGVVWSDSATVSVAETIVTHPVSQTVCEQDPAVFVVGAVGASLTYQWRKDGFDIAGATEAVFIIGSTTLADSGVYDVAVVSARCTQISDPATLTVEPCP